MQSVTLAYRNVDRLPVICAIREMAKRHYDYLPHALAAGLKVLRFPIFPSSATSPRRARRSSRAEIPHCGISTG
jgi:hypothetical protein